MAANSPPRSEGLPQPLSSNIAKKKRGGRQLRQVVLSPELKFSIRQFAAQVGMPRLMEPTGFRDFRGWLERVSGPSAADAWSSLVQSMMDETAGDAYRILFIKEEVVREIVRSIVVPRPGESAKLVSTNCGRQCARPRSGNTLMTILERILVEKGIVSASDIEIFMNERSPPYTPPYREGGLAGMTGATGAQGAQGAGSQYMAGRRSMSLEAITSAPEMQVQQPQATLAAVSDTHPPNSGDVLSRPSFEMGLQVAEQDLLRGLQSSDSTSRGVNLSTTASTVSSQMTAIQGGDRLTYAERLPSFQELEESLDKEKQ